MPPSRPFSYYDAHRTPYSTDSMASILTDKLNNQNKILDIMKCINEFQKYERCIKSQFNQKHDLMDKFEKYLGKN